MEQTRKHWDVEKDVPIAVKGALRRMISYSGAEVGVRRAGQSATSTSSS